MRAHVEPRQRREGGRQLAARRAPPPADDPRTGADDEEGARTPGPVAQPLPPSAPPHRATAHVAIHLVYYSRISTSISTSTGKRRRNRSCACGCGGGCGGGRGRSSSSRRQLAGVRSPQKCRRRPARGQRLASQATPLAGRCNRENAAVP